MIDIREILVRIFSAIFLSMCTGSCMFVFWMALRKFFADKIRPKVYDLILKIILIAYYVPAGYLLVNIFFDNGYVFDFTGTIIKAFYAISLFWLAGAIATVLKFGERTFRIRREKERCFPCKMYVQKIFEDCKRELGIRRSITRISHSDSNDSRNIKTMCVFTCGRYGRRTIKNVYLP